MTIPLPEPSHGFYYGVPMYSADQMLAYGDAVRAEERERLRAALMEKHEAAKGRHNLYHCLAVEMFGELGDTKKGPT